MDAITLAAIGRELDETLVSGRVQVVLQPDEQSLALEIFRDGERRWLLISIDVKAPRVHLLRERARRGVTRDGPFLLLARKRLRGARLTRLIQPTWERIIYLAFTHPVYGDSVLVAEIMGRWSNLVLNDGNSDVLASLRHFERNERTQRTVRPGHPYMPPPPQRHKLPIDLIKEEDLKRLLHQTVAGKPFWRILVQNIAGLSPLAARELLFRTTGDAQADVTHPNLHASNLMEVIMWFRTLPRQGGWAPTVALDTQGHPQAFAPYELTHLKAIAYLPSISVAAQMYYEAMLGADSYAGRRQEVLALITQARKKLLARQASLGKQAVGEEDVAQLRAFGEWILTYAWKIRPGDKELLADTGEEILYIPLDPTKTPSENAQAYFARYQKAKRAAEKIPELLVNVDRDLAWLDQLEHDTLLADNSPQLEEIKEILLASGLVAASKRKRTKAPRSRPIHIHTSEGFDIFLGRNALQNEQLTWKLAHPEDYWLHAQDVPGSHVLIRTQGRKPPESILLQAASWAAWHSRARNDTKVSVIVTQRKHLRKVKGGRPGQVRIRTYRTLTVPPTPPPTTTA